MKKNPDGSVTLTEEEAREHDNAMSMALTRLRSSTKAATEGGPADLFGIKGTTARFILDTSGSMSSGMNGDYSSAWSGSKMASLHELMRTIAAEVAVEIICIGNVPKNINGAERHGETCVVFDEEKDPHDRVIQKSQHFGAWIASEVPPTGAGSTPLWAGLQLALNNGWTDVTVLSDGLPQDIDRALRRAAHFLRIDAWYLGNGDEYATREGRNFMKALHRGAGTFGSTNLGDAEVRRRIANHTIGYLAGYGAGG